MVPTEIIHNQTSEPSLIDLNLLERRVKKLEKLCQEVDPFIPLTEELKNELSMFGIETWRDPDHLTKQIILMFEDSVKELRDLKENSIQ
ncbi:MAG: archaellum component FlaC [Bacteriovoracaceae bacterium]|jgi:archaellum component FlaC